ncbi:hypothetical protein [Umezawaea sp. Da 62-37]|uniref:hypothetical protein n=1 Tax=Umezawaea sp. Da 62-37 TaxID=3075927 RepID=UPI0028F70657|nr:hypothetical protein [Umezawaea sp. Da 62-37]WNV86194.1 hypothetical protein RM788_50140 [Umezawaea sp. Da 62-37]
MSDPPGANIADDDGRDRRPRTSDSGRGPRVPGSFRFAATAAALGLVVSLGSGLGTMYVPRLWATAPVTTPPPGTSTPWSTTGYPSWSTTTTTTVQSGPPTGFYRHTSPQGLVTVLPDAFVPANGQAKGTQVAKDPTDPDVEVRFGGDAQESTSLLETITKAAGVESVNPQYTQVELRRTTHGDREAVEWEFVKPNPDGDVRQTRAHYWRADGVEYVLLVTAPADRFADAARILTTMIRYSETH